MPCVFAGSYLSETIFATLPIVESFYDIARQIQWDQLSDEIRSCSEDDVLLALNRRGRRTPRDFMALISPAAAPYLEEMARQSRNSTLKRFGKTMQLYIPLYLSNECTNQCTYCGFSQTNDIPRRTLSMDEILQEAAVIRSWGFEHLLLVTGEAQSRVGMDYFKQVLMELRPMFSQISMEVQPLDEDEYGELIDLGLYAVYVYQETYHQENYRKYHLAGKKSLYQYRVETPERLGRAGIRKMGLGTLLGLEDWRVDSYMTALHLNWLEKRFWKSRFSISFPRLRPHEGEFFVEHPISDPEFVQLICAWRLFNEDVELSLSTRESSAFRDNLIPLGITSMSAASSTEPGGYAEKHDDLEQFAIDDSRSAAEVARAIREKGYETVWKDWVPQI